MKYIKYIFTLLIALSSSIFAAEMNQMTKEQAYTILSQASGMQVNSSSNEDEIKKAYRKALLKWHPDQNQAQQEKATENTKWINHAYEILTCKSQPASSSSSSQQPHQERKEDPERANAYFENANILFNRATECTLGIHNQLYLLTQAATHIELARPSKLNAKEIKILERHIISKKSFYVSLYSLFEKYKPYLNHYNSVTKDGFLDHLNIDEYITLQYELHLKDVNISKNEMENIKIGMADLKAKSEYYLGKYYLECTYCKKRGEKREALEQAHKYLSRAKEYFLNSKMPNKEALAIFRFGGDFIVEVALADIEAKLQDIENLRKSSCTIL